MKTSWHHLLLLAVSLPGCPKPYSGKAAVSARAVTGDVGGYVEIAATLQPGTAMHTGAPQVAALTEARCLDESVCETALREGKALVGGKKEGTSEVRLAFVQPNGGETTVQTVTVRFRARHTVGFSIGPQAPAMGAARVLELGSAHSPSRYRCAVQKLSFLDAGDATRGDAHMYACSPGLELAPGRWYLPSGDHPATPSSAAVFVCQRQRVGTGERASLVVFRKDSVAGLQRLSYEGEPSDVCKALD